MEYECKIIELYGEWNADVAVHDTLVKCHAPEMPLGLFSLTNKIYLKKPQIPENQNNLPGISPMLKLPSLS